MWQICRRHLVAWLVVILGASGLTTIDLISGPVPAAHAAFNCKSEPEVCKYRVVAFSGNSRKATFIRRERTLHPKGTKAFPICDRYRMRMYQDGSAKITLCGLYARNKTGRIATWWIFPHNFWGGAWKTVKCSAAVITAVVPLAKAAKYVKELGGIKDTALLIIKAGSWKDLAKAAPGLASQIIGIAAIENNCF